MRRVTILMSIVLLATLLAACGEPATNLADTSGTAESRTAVTPTAAAVTSTATPADIPTPLPTATSASTPTPQPTPTPTAKQLSVQTTGFAQETDGRTVGWAFTVENPNDSLAVESTEYQVAFSDANGTIILTYSGYIELMLPSEKTGVAGTSLLPENTRVDKIDVTLNQGQVSQTGSNVAFSTDKVTLLPNDYLPRVTGVVTNPYNRDLQDLRLSAIAYDSNGAIIGAGYSFLHFIPAKGTAAGSVSVIASAQPDHVELFAAVTSLTTLAASTSSADNGEPLVLSKQGFGLLTEMSEAGWGFIIENPNADQSYEDSLYQVAFYDSDGFVVGTDSGYINLILAGEKLGVGGTVLLPDGRTASRVVVQVLKGDSISATAKQLFSTDNVNFVADKYFPKITGTVKNLTDQKMENIRVTGIAYDEAGNIVGGGMTYLDFVPAGSSIAVAVNIVSSGNPARVELYPTVSSLTDFTP